MPSTFLNKDRQGECVIFNGVAVRRNTMSIGNAIGEFSYTSTGVTVSISSNNIIESQVNFEGSATGYGTVISTLTFYKDDANAENGKVKWVGICYLESGEQVTGSSEGVFDTIGDNQWRLRSMVKLSDGTLLISDGIVNLKGRTFNGEIFPWT